VAMRRIASLKGARSGFRNGYPRNSRRRLRAWTRPAIASSSDSAARPPRGHERDLLELVSRPSILVVGVVEDHPWGLVRDLHLEPVRVDAVTFVQPRHDNLLGAGDPKTRARYTPTMAGSMRPTAHRAASARRHHRAQWSVGVSSRRRERRVR